MKPGIVWHIQARNIRCPECGGICISKEAKEKLHRHHNEIRRHEKVAICETCGKECKVPEHAFSTSIASYRKLQAIEEQHVEH